MYKKRFEYLIMRAMIFSHEMMNFNCEKDWKKGVSEYNQEQI